MERDFWEDLRIDGRIILKVYRKEIECEGLDGIDLDPDKRNDTVKNYRSL